MLIDWPEQKAKLYAALEEVMRSRVHRGLVAEVRGLTVYEGNRALLIGVDGAVGEIQMKEIQAEVRVENWGTAGPEAVAKVVNDLGSEIGDQVEKGLIRSIQNTDSRIGGMFGGKDEETVFQDLITKLRDVEIGFDDDGQPSIFFVAHPDNAPMLQSLNTPERQAIFNEIMSEKRNEWIRRESNRRLVD